MRKNKKHRNMKKTFFTVIGFMIICQIYGRGQTAKLDNILQHLEEIKTASYYSKSSSSAPGDTLAFRTYERYVNMYINPADTFLGASYTTSSIDDNTALDMCYDGTYKVRFDWTNRNVQIDTLSSNPNRRPTAPFFMKVKSLIQYTKDNIDSSTIKYFEFKDSIKINISFKDKIVEFMSLKPFIRESEGKVSRYEIVIDKNYLPYKFIRKMPHQTSWETCSNIQISNHLDFEFSSVQQIPADFKIKGRERGEPKSYELEGTTATDWKLKEIYGDSISLRELEQKVILIQFTGIGCGPCHASIPFLKKIAVDYKGKDFELICIETWSNNIAGIERYKDKNELNYKFLVSKNEIKDEYKIQGVPTFFILDDKRVIKKVIVGYQKGDTDKEIIKIIDDML